MDVVYLGGACCTICRGRADGFRALAKLLVPGGMLVAWCYAREGSAGCWRSSIPRDGSPVRLPLRVVSGLAAG